MKKFYSKVQILSYYNLGGEYLIFEDSLLHNKTFNNVNVEIKTQKRKIFDMIFEEDVICIEGEETIYCELMSANIRNGTLILKICQDWG